MNIRGAFPTCLNGLLKITIEPCIDIFNDISIGLSSALIDLSLNHKVKANVVVHIQINGLK